MNSPSFHYRLLFPQHWLTWIGFGIWWLLAQLPYSIQMRLGSLLSRFLAIFAKRRITIAKRNLELCFPHLSEKEHQTLLSNHINSLGKVFFEIGIAWFWSQRRLLKLVTYEGFEHLTAAHEQGKGVILMAVHFGHMELAGSFINNHHPMDFTYRQHLNPVYDLIQHNRRRRFNKEITPIERKDMRRMIKSLRKGRRVWYAPDQDFGIRHSIFLPFFGVQAACLTTTSTLAELGNAILIQVTCIRLPKGQYHLKISSPVENFPSNDLVRDTKTVVSLIENAISKAPDQYLWVHRRFKNQPEGAPDLYSSNLLRQSK